MNVNDDDMTDDTIEMHGAQGYTVGTPHPTSVRRQLIDLTPRELADLGDAVVFTLERELISLDIASGERADQWSLAARLRQVIVDHYRECRERSQHA